MLNVNWKITANCKLRVDISHSNYLTYHVNPNLDSIWSKSDEKNNPSPYKFFW